MNTHSHMHSLTPPSATQGSTYWWEADSHPGADRVAHQTQDTGDRACPLAHTTEHTHMTMQSPGPTQRPRPNGEDTRGILRARLQPPPHTPSPTWAQPRMSAWPAPSTQDRDPTRTQPGHTGATHSPGTRARTCPTQLHTDGHATTHIIASGHASLCCTHTCAHTPSPSAGDLGSRHVTPPHTQLHPCSLTHTHTFLLHRWRGGRPQPHLPAPCTLHAQRLRARVCWAPTPLSPERPTWMDRD